MLERLLEEIPGTEVVTDEMKKAFRHLIPVLPWFDDLKIKGLYISGSDDLVLSCRQGDSRGISTFGEPNSFYPGLIIYPVKGTIDSLRFERDKFLSGCSLKRADKEGFIIAAQCLVGDYLMPYCAIIKINNKYMPLN